mmetsp:Transcript_11377/g.19484  ORF Transcript_11377/g.19484 Transcript_11377/m.19484 type:complete len:264 (-) Transcript_11377:165-956(-)
MASETEPETQYKESPFADEVNNTIPAKVHIVAPSTLPEGYVFDAEVGPPGYRKTVTVEVPPGGVVEGQVFLADLPEDFGDNLPQVNIPTGQWKDGLFDIFSAGFFHPSVVCGFCFTQIGMGQLMQRLRLNWLGEGGEDESAKISFKIVLTLVICYTVFTVSLELAEAAQYYYNIPAYIPSLKFIGGVLFTIYSIIALMRVRESVRAKYSIPETRFAGCEDAVYSAACSCCVVAQIARHTGEYETYKGSYFSDTGMAPGTPQIV